MASYSSISSAIATIVNGVSGLDAVYTYDPQAMGTDTVVAAIVAAKHKDKFIDTAHNERKYYFYIYLYAAMDQNNTWESTLETIADEVIAAIESNITLSGACNFALPTSSKWYEGKKDVNIRICRIKIVTKTRVLR
jgi:hypothetical protein